MTTTLTTGLTTAKSYLEAFSQVEKSLPGMELPALARQRRAAIARFGELGFPGERNEDWKFTNLAPLLKTPLQLATSASTSVRVDGTLPKGVVVQSLAEALTLNPALLERHLGQHADFKNHAFAALNTALWQEGVLVYVPANIVVETPITIEHSAPGEGELAHRRVLVVVGKGAQVRLSEIFHGTRGTYANNTLTEVILEEGALVDHYKVQEESTSAFHIACTQAVVAGRANFSTHYIGLGGGLVRNEVRVLFTGEHAEATVNGLYRAAGSQHADNHTVIDHAQPNCASHELYKGILDGRARGVFNGKIFVRLDAQKTDAKQTNQTLLLSDDAVINTKPQLEIFADDVKCTHGATVGQLDEQQLFYLRARGIGEAQARALLTFAFANDIINRVRVADLRRRLEHALLEANHLPRLEEDE